MMIRRLRNVLAAGVLSAAGIIAASQAAEAAEAEPFTVQDLVRLERVTEPAVSPDGKLIVYTVRTTDLQANKGRMSIWLLDRRKRNASPVRITDLAANSNSAAWSHDGNFVYYLSNRGGSSQVWRIEARHWAPGAEPEQVTRLALDVGSFRVSPRGGPLVGEHGGVHRLRRPCLYPEPLGCRGPGTGARG